MSEPIEKKSIDNKIIEKMNNFQNQSKKFLSTIDYNYPSLNRKDLYDLSNINDKSHQFKKLNTNRDWSLNLYNLDIEGSSPKKFGYFSNKEDFTNKNSDIEKSSPKNYYPNINKKSFNLTNDDIEFSSPHCVKYLTTRHTNPLEPKYSLRYPEPMPIPPPKFIRDSMEINDIKGTKPKKFINERNLFKEIIKKDEIKDSWPKKPYVRKSKYEYMDYRDVTKNNLNYRNTNPLKPIYNWNYSDKLKIYGPIEGNNPSCFSKYMIKNPFNLTNKDIEGTNPGSKNKILKFNGSNNCYNTQDIIGAQRDTLKKGIVTKRNINPIYPKYKYLGHSEISGIDNNPYNFRFRSIDNFNIKNYNKKIDFNTNNSINYNINTIKSENIDFIDKKNENIFNSNKFDNTDNKNKELLLKNIKIIDDKKEINNNNNDVYIRNGGKPDFGNFPTFNDTLQFEKNNYKNPEVNYGLSQYQYRYPSDINQNELSQNSNKFEKLKIPLNPLNKKEMRTRSISTFSQDSYKLNNKLEDFINSRNLKDVEGQTNTNKNDINNNLANNENKNLETTK